MSRRAGMVVAGAIVMGVVVWLAATAIAQDDVSPGGKPSRTITVTSTATVKVTPDEAVVDPGVRSESAAGADAIAQNAKTMQAVLNALGSAGIANKDVQTTNVSLEQHTENRGQARRATGVRRVQLRAGCDPRPVHGRLGDRCGSGSGRGFGE